MTSYPALAVLDRLRLREHRGLFAEDREALRIEILARAGRLPARCWRACAGRRRRIRD